MKEREVPHISVCIPTFRRPELLGMCLDALQNQDTSGFTFSVVIVDNDRERSAERVVQDRSGRTSLEIRYEVEPEQNISLSRNRAVAAAEGDLIAFIDDDEIPDSSWLRELSDSCTRYAADGVLGPVLPQYEGIPPRWLERSGLCIRESFPTGTILKNAKHMRTGNVLLRRSMMNGSGPPFDPGLGRSGGEDVDFFIRMLRENRTFVWCDEARVHELVPLERQKKSYYLRRACMRGVNTAGREPLMSLGTLRSLAAVTVYTAGLPFFFLAGQHLFMKNLVRNCDHVSKLLAHAGIRLVRERTF